MWFKGESFLVSQLLILNSMFKAKRFADVVVIGGGIIGCATAYRLAQEKLSVLVVERDRPGSEASRAAGGILGAQAEATTRHPYLDLCLKSRELHARLAERLRDETGIDVEYRSAGLVYLAFTEEEARALEDRRRWQKEAGLAVEQLTPVEMHELEPSISSQARLALYFPSDGQVHNVKLTGALETAAKKLGVRFLNGSPVSRLVIDREKAIGVQALDETIYASWFVNAAGSWAGSIDMGLAYAIPVRPVRGQIVSVESCPSSFRRIIYSSRCYLVPRLDGTVLIGSTMERVGYNKRVTLQGVETLLRSALEIAPELAGCSFREAWAGLRPCTEDHMPILGTTEIGGLILATGHCRNGILLAPVTAELVAELIISGHTSMDIDFLSPRRFVIGSTSPGI